MKKLSLKTLAIYAFLLAFFVSSRSFADSAKDHWACKKGNFTLAQMIENEHNNITEMSWATVLPEDVIIDFHQYRYAVNHILYSYRLPVIDNSHLNIASGRLPPRPEDTNPNISYANCRIQTTDGNWWLVGQYHDGAISYTLQSQIEILDPIQGVKK